MQNRRSKAPATKAEAFNAAAYQNRAARLVTSDAAGMCRVVAKLIQSARNGEQQTFAMAEHVRDHPGDETDKRLLVRFRQANNLRLEKVRALLHEIKRQALQKLPVDKLCKPLAALDDWLMFGERTDAAALEALDHLCVLFGSDHRAPAAEDDYRPASAYPKGLGPALRQAANPKRKNKRVATMVIDGVKCYRDADVQRWYAHIIKSMLDKTAMK